MTRSLSDSDKLLRYACDRCHSQKLRCPRSLDSKGVDEPCSRCHKAGVPCVVSLRGKVGRPSKAAKKKRSLRQATPHTTPEMEYSPCGSNVVLDSFEAQAHIDQPWCPESGELLVGTLDMKQQMQPDVLSPGQSDSKYHDHYRRLPGVPSAGRLGGQQELPDNLPSAGMVNHPCP